MKLYNRCPPPDAILAHYRRSLEALDVLWETLQAAVPLASCFDLMTPEEREQARRDMYQELNDQTVLLLAASFEAVFQIDLHRRVNQKQKDPLSKKLRKLWKHRRRSGRLEFEDLLEFWKKETGRRFEIGELKQLIQFRHWLAHGRYWERHSGLTVIDPEDAWERGRAVFDFLPGVPKLNEY
jgi:hypothetical protein